MYNVITKKADFLYQNQCEFGGFELTIYVYIYI